MKKKLLALFCVITCIFGLTACGSEKTYTEFENAKMENAKILAQVALEVTVNEADAATQLLSMYNKAEMAEAFKYDVASQYGFEYNLDLGAFDGLLTTYNQMVKEMGEIKSVGEYTAEISGKSIIVTTEVDGVNCDGSITFTFTNDTFTKLTKGDAVANTTFNQKMKEAGSHMGDAGLNTLLGMGSVFIVLILISFIIASFNLFKSKPKKVEEVKETVSSQNETVEELTDDTELVAVIMAAISAFESANGGSSDGFVVRSIKKANRRN